MGVSWTKETITNSGTAGTTTAESLTIDNIKIDGTTIGHTSDTDLLTFASAVLTLKGTLSIDTTTDASSTTTGSFHTDGGVGIAKKLYVGTDLDVDGTANLDAVDIDGAVQIDNTVTVGVDDTGYDVKFFGDTASNYMLWNTSSDKLEINTTHNNTALLIKSSATRSVSDAPDLVILKNTAPNDGDYLGSVKFRSLDAGDSSVRTYSEIDTYVRDADDNTADGSMIFSVLSHGAGTQALKIRSSNNGADAKVQTQVVNGALLYDEVTFGDDDNTPRVDGGNIFITGDMNGASVKITQLDNGASGQMVIITVADSGTAPEIDDGGNFLLSANWAPASHDTLTLFTKNGTTWREISRSDN